MAESVHSVASQNPAAEGRFGSVAAECGSGGEDDGEGVVARKAIACRAWLTDKRYLSMTKIAKFFFEL